MANSELVIRPSAIYYDSTGQLIIRNGHNKSVGLDRIMSSHAGYVMAPKSGLHAIGENGRVNLDYQYSDDLSNIRRWEVRPPEIGEGAMYQQGIVDGHWTPWQPVNR